MGEAGIVPVLLKVGRRDRDEIVGYLDPEVG
jgi:hypothetical protein